MEEIRINAHAKLNLSLEVVGRRDNGYHNIVSLMQGIGLHDIVSVKKCAQNGTKYNLPHCTIEGRVVYLCTNVRTIPADMNNLALKGIEALLKEAKYKDAAFAQWEDTGALMIEIEKKLPVAAGIAGGSGNGAAAMLGLNALGGFPFSLRELMDIGAGFGADIPFSLFMNAYRNRDLLSDMSGIEEASDSAWTGGIGDIVEPAQAIPRYVVMANPGISVSTEHAYRAIDAIGYDDSNPKGSGRLFVNELEKYTLAAYPKAQELKAFMQESLDADEVLMSGSGPTVAAYYKDPDRAEAGMAAMIKRSETDPELSCWLTTTGITQEEAF